MGHYDRLSALDASFLEIEDESSHMTVAAIQVFDPGSLRTSEGGIDADRIRSYLESRLHLLPRYRQKLAHIPIEQHPVWVDDPSFNVLYHVRHTALPRPGDERQLKRLCGRILSQKLDHTKPLWEFWIVEGLASGRLALITKVHHCMVDGVSGAGLLTVLLSPEVTESFSPGPPWKPRPAPSGVQLMAGEALRRASIPVELARSAASLLADPARAVTGAWDQARGLVETIGEALTPASETPLNPPAIGPHRRFDWLSFELAQAKAVKNALGGTLNDVVLATVAGAMRRFLSRRGVDTDSLDFRALVPVSLRRSPQDAPSGNRVAQLVAHLPLDEPDPHRRLARVVETTRELKRSHRVEATQMVEELSDWTATALMTQTMRIAADRRVYNLIVTNVPGPPMPLYMLDARLLGIYPMAPLFVNQALAVGLFSYAGGLHVGLNADWDAMPDLHEVVDDLRVCFAELCEAARAGGAHHASAEA